MTHLACHEWGKVAVGDNGFSRNQADKLLDAARAHRLGGVEGTEILCDHHRHLTARQMVGVIAAQGCSLEILPKIDDVVPDEGATLARSRLIQMLDAALGLRLSTGETAKMALNATTLLDVFIGLFADRLLEQVRYGLPRRYCEEQDDLRSLRGRLDVVRQFTVHAVRPDRLSCRFDTLSSDTPLMCIMKFCVIFLSSHARANETKRKLTELRFLLADIPDAPRNALPWKAIQIDRTNQRWQALLDLAKMFLKGQWQETHHQAAGDNGITLLFPMNILFEAYVTAMLRRALVGTDIEVIAQGGLRYCLGNWTEDADCRGNVFQTKPDIILRRNGQPITIIDTKWKRLSADPLDRKFGVSQADVYQLMGYARLYQCDHLMLLYPSMPGAGGSVIRSFGIDKGRERLDIASIDVAGDRERLMGELRNLASSPLPPVSV